MYHVVSALLRPYTFLMLGLVLTMALVWQSRRPRGRALTTALALLIILFLPAPTPEKRPPAEK
jgi:hypothetical protein